MIVVFGFMSLALNLHLSKEAGLSMEGVQEYLMQSFTASLGGIAGQVTAEDTIHQGDDPSADGHTLAGLNCDKYGGPSQEAASEMVYWSDIPSDSHHVSPFKRKEGPTQYLTFEPDQGGWYVTILICVSLVAHLYPGLFSPVKYSILLAFLRNVRIVLEFNNRC